MKARDQVYKPLIGYTSPFRKYKVVFFFSERNVVKTKITGEKMELMVKVLLLTALSSHCYQNVITNAGLTKPFQNTPSTNIK